jgi:hypothetical protein
MIAVLALLMIVGGFSLTIVRSLAARRQMLRGEEQRIQAEWLAEAGLERAAAKLSATGDDKPETWNITDDELGGRGAGRVTIRWDEATPDTQDRRVHIEAEYPVGQTTQAVARRDFLFHPKSKAPGDTP